MWRERLNFCKNTHIFWNIIVIIIHFHLTLTWYLNHNWKRCVNVELSSKKMLAKSWERRFILIDSIWARDWKKFNFYKLIFFFSYQKLRSTQLKRWFQLCSFISVCVYLVFFGKVPHEINHPATIPTFMKYPNVYFRKSELNIMKMRRNTIPLNIKSKYTDANINKNK